MNGLLPHPALGGPYKPARGQSALLVAALAVLAAAAVGAGAWLYCRPGRPLFELWRAWRRIIVCRQEVDSDARGILTATKEFQLERGRWPESIAELLEVVGPDGKKLPMLCVYLPRDPWDNVYLYTILGGAPRVTCLGSDGQPGGDGEAADRVFRLEQDGVREE
jgi:hypothetical protein